ncbi:MAG TPA: response regulator [Planctomycetota bacterium]|nr:response regulator [Planctomycetota bacterium]
MRALIVDDSKTIRDLLGDILRDLGFEVHDAENGEAALAALDALQDVDVVLVDWIMPEMDGLSFVKAVRSRRERDKVRLLMVTTQTEMPRVVTALEAGADEYLMKPVTREMVRQKLELMGIVLV